MRQIFLLTLATALFFTSFSGTRGAQRKRKDEEPKPQVFPLPPELPMALTAETNSLDFHISSLLKTGGLSAQIRQCLNDLIRDTRGETIVKLRAFVAGAGDARRVQAEAAGIFTERKLPLPVLSILQVGALGAEPSQVVIEAVVSTHRLINPAGLAFVSGQYGSTFADAVDRLQRSVSAAHVPPDRILTTTCFTPTDNYEMRRAQLQAAFPKTEINIVQALRDPMNDATMCEAVGQLVNPPSQGSVIFLKDVHVTLVNAKRLVFTGLQLCFGSFLDDAHEAFQRLQRATVSAGPSGEPVQVNAFSLTPAAGSALRKMTSFPPGTLTVQTVEGLTALDATAGVEAVLAPHGGAPSEFRN